MRRRRIRVLVALLAAVLAGIATAVALAAIPDSNGVIHGCYTTAGGSLRVVNASSECFVTETPLDWGVEGPAGAAGSQGPQGLPGVAGDEGPVGPQGPTGPAGADGVIGPTGPAGPEGELGPTGSAGPEGEMGPTGPAGADGLPGVAGPQGAPGPIGPSDAFASSTPRTMRLRRSPKIVERLDLDAGAHVLLAKVVLSQRARRSTRVMCTLGVGSGLDRSMVRLVPAPAATTVHLLLAADPGAPAVALLRCRHYSPASARVFAANVQLTAIKLSTLTVQ